MQPGNDIRAGTPITMRNMCSNEAVHKFYFSTGGDMEDVKRLKQTVLTYVEKNACTDTLTIYTEGQRDHRWQGSRQRRMVAHQ